MYLFDLSRSITGRYFDCMPPQSIEPQQLPGEDTVRTNGASAAFLFRRICGRHVMDMALLMLVMVMFSVLNKTQDPLSDPDLWWHLSNARTVCVSHTMIWADPYSFTTVGQRWINWEWLAELPFWFGYSAWGLKGIYAVTFLTFYANTLFLYWRGVAMTGRRD